MSQDSNMFHHGGSSSSSNFQTSPFDPNHLYQDMPPQLQFAASVPPSSTSSAHRPSPPSSQSLQHHVEFGGAFSNQDVLMQQASTANFSMNYPGSPYERSESIINNNSSNTTGKQVQSKAERRAEHNAIERARRESLNVKFQQLAFTLPNLQNDSRPSKSTIIDRTLDFVKGAILKEDRMQYRIQELEKFNRYLLAELDRKTSGEKVNVKEMKEKQQETSAANSPMMNNATSPPPGSIMSEDSENDMMMKESSSTPSPPPSLTQKTLSPTHSFNVTGRKRNSTSSISNRRNHPVSRSSVPMIPKLEYSPPPLSTTNWPTTEQFLVEQQQQRFIKEVPHHPMMPTTTANLFAQAPSPQSFTPQQQQATKFHHHPQENGFTTMTTTNFYDMQQQQQQQHMMPATNSYFNNSPHHYHHLHLQQQQHRR